MKNFDFISIHENRDEIWLQFKSQKFSDVDKYIISQMSIKLAFEYNRICWGNNDVALLFPTYSGQVVVKTTGLACKLSTGIIELQIYSNDTFVAHYSCLKVDLANSFLHFFARRRSMRKNELNKAVIDDNTISENMLLAQIVA